MQPSSPIVRGQRVTFPLTSGGTLQQTGAQTLCRGEDKSQSCWQVTLAPIVQNGKVTANEGMPAWQGTPGATGTLLVIVTYGGGGVSFRFAMPYPVNGASFAVSGDNVQVDVEARDTTTVFTEVTKPAVLAWIAPRAVPTSYDPIIRWEAYANGAAVPLFPCVKAIIVGRDDSTATVTVQFDGAILGAPLIVELPATVGVERIPVPWGAETVTVTPSAGVAYWGEEVSFT